MPLALLNRFKELFINVSPGELEKRYHHLLILLAITIIAYGLVGLGYDFLSLKLLKVQKSRPVVEVAAPLGVIRKEPAEAYIIIPQRNLFGSTEKAVFEKKSAEAETPVEGPDLAAVVAIKGIVAGTGKDGFVVVEEQGKNKQMLYKVGNVVAGAKLINIARNAVTFLVGDKEKVLKMVETSEGPLLPARPSQPPAIPGRGGPMVISRSEVDASLKDMGTLLSQAQVRPYYMEGAPAGFMIANIRPGSVYEKIGLINGDIIQGVDGRKLTTAEDVMALYSSMKSGASFALQIKRGGRDQSLQYVFR